MKWGAQHLYANMRLFNATQDYVAARCCILNGLFVGFTLASQAIEKLLKAIIYLESGEEMHKSHDPYALKEKLKAIKDYHLDPFDLTLKKLFDHYQSRYHETHPHAHADGSCGASSAELVYIDELWFVLVEKLPMPDEVKYRTAFFVELFEPNPYWLNGTWLTKNNHAFDTRKADLSVDYFSIRTHLYGQ